MDVLLLQDVDNLGLAGDVAKVSPGYGRNFLLPQKLAVLATPSAMKSAEAIRNAGELKRAQEKADAEAIRSQIQDTALRFERRAGEQDKLYGSVTSGDIADGLQAKLGLEIDRRKIALGEPIRSLGDHTVVIKLMSEVSAEINVKVTREGEEDAPPAAPEAETETAEVTE